MQGARYGIIMDSLINDFVSGEIEYAVWNAWNEQRPDAIIIEGQGSLMNPAYPGGFEILAAGPAGRRRLAARARAQASTTASRAMRMHPLQQQIRRSS